MFFAKINNFFHSVIANGFFLELIFCPNQVTFATNWKRLGDLGTWGLGGLGTRRLGD